MPVLLAKVLVFTGVVTTTMVAASFVAFVSAQALLAQYRPGSSPGDPDVLRYVIGTGVYLTLVGMLGGAIGWLVRSTPGALVTFFALVLVVPGIVGGFFGTIGQQINQWLPSEAGASWIQTLHPEHSLSPWTGFAVLLAWVVGATAIAAVQLRRRDA